MKVTATVPFFDNTGLHKVGEVVEVETFDERRMMKVETEKAEKAPKKTTKKG